MISSTIHRFLQHLYKHTRVFQSLKSLHILFHHLPPFWDHFMRAVNPWIIPCVEAICHSAPRGPLKAESAERDYKSRGLPRTYQMPWRYSEEPKPSGNKSCSSSVRLWSFSWDERKRIRHARPRSTCITPLDPWRRCESCPARCVNNWLTRRSEGWSWKLRKKITEWAAGFLSGAKVTGLVSYQCW